MERLPLIVITNDDGIGARGINLLAELMAGIGEVILMAPTQPQSGQSNAITTTTPLRYHLVGRQGRITRYACTGTPTDCVKMALDEVLRDRRPDLLVSGINHGSNASINVIYSGTMGAVLEGCECGITSVGFSLTDHDPEADFSHFQPYIPHIARTVLQRGLPHGVCLNVNAPVGPIKGIRAARQCDACWTDGFEKRTLPSGRGHYYWMTGEFKNNEPHADDTDEWALANGYISIVPTRIDFTDYTLLEEMKNWDL